MIRVKATREGLIGRATASGYVIDDVVPFVALPSTLAIGKFIRVTNVANNATRYAIVLDVGPWNTHDDDYVFRGARPQAESGLDKSGRPTNGAGIDLGERIWIELGMIDNGEVEWEFI
jgi:hypothetical protein